MEKTNLLLKLEKAIFYIFLFILPFNTRKIIFSWGKYFNEYQAAFIYASDILIISILLSWLTRYLVEKKNQKLKIPQKKDFGLLLNKQNLKQIPNSLKESPRLPEKKASFQILKLQFKSYLIEILLCLFLLWCFTSLLWAANFGLGFYKWLKLAEFSLFFLYLKNNLKNYKFEHIAKIIISFGIIQSFIAFAQFIGQKSLGLYLLGESHFGLGIPGTATFRIFGAKIVRASGTLPHANLLAAILIFSFFLLIWLYLKRPVPLKLFTSFSYLFKEIIFGISFFFIALGIILSFSRSAILLLAIFIPLIIIAIFINKSLRKEYALAAAKLIIILTITAAFLLAIFSDFLFARANISLKEAAINHRLIYNQMALDLIKKYPVSGVGFSNYIWFLNQNNLWKNYGFTLPYLFQPVHNIYLLIAAEIGIIGLIIFILLIYFIVKNSWPLNKNFLFSIFYFLFSIFIFWGFSDHFLWTINQGQLIWWLILGILIGAQKSNQNIN